MVRTTSPRSPLLARLLAPPGPPTQRLFSRNGAQVMAVPGRYCVTYLLVGPDSVVVVDVGSTKDRQRLANALDALGRPVTQVRTVMPTHLHFDHIMGIDALACELGVPVTFGHVAHEAVTRGRKLRFPRGLHTLRAIPTYFMQGAPRAPLSDWLTRLDFGFPWSRNRFKATLASPIAHEGELPDVPGWRVLDAPGHADDAVCFYHEEARFLVAGDTVRNFVRGEWNPLLCDRRDYQRTQAMLKSLNVDTVFPGHGPVLEGEQILTDIESLPFFYP